jgi:alkyldihydroxyacetonephosphate synthase
MSSWWGWGARPKRADATAARLVADLERRWGSLPVVAERDVQLGTAESPRGTIERLRDALGADAVRDDPPTRARHAIGQSYPELLDAQHGVVTDPPLAVLAPTSSEQIAIALTQARALGLAVVPYGGGTSVTGGVAGPPDAHVVLSLRGLRGLRSIDAASRVALVDAGILGPELEAALGAHGLTLGHFPQSFDRSTVGGWVATRSAGQLSTGVGAIDDMVVGLRVVAPEGVIALDARPPASEGPDLLQVFLGSEGRFGVITEVALQIRPRPQTRLGDSWLFPRFADGIDAVRGLVQDGLAAQVLRLSDEAETVMVGVGGGGALLVTMDEGDEAATAGRAARAATALGRRSRQLGPEPSERWYATRFDAPYLRDALLERGVIADSVETAALWSSVDDVYRGVRTALAGALDDDGRALVLCHLSHAYTVGASLYFTFIAPGGDDAAARWAAAKRAGLDAMLANGGVVSHHHGIGRHHREWQERRLGPLAMDVIEGIARTLDPAHVLAANRIG